MVQSGAICAKVQDFQREANCLFDAVASTPKVSTPKTLERDLVSYVIFSFTTYYFQRA